MTNAVTQRIDGAVYLMVAQQGVIAALPSELGGKAVTHDMSFYEASGALKSYNLLSQPAVNKGVVDSLSTTSNALLDAQKKQKDAEANAAYNTLKKESEMLQFMLNKQSACAGLANPPRACDN